MQIGRITFGPESRRTFSRADFDATPVYEPANDNAPLVAEATRKGDWMQTFTDRKSVV